jgi:hypothetical protein
MHLLYFSLSVHIFSDNISNSDNSNHSQPHFVFLNILSIYSKYFSFQDMLSTHFADIASVFEFLCVGRGKFLKI